MKNQKTSLLEIISAIVNIVISATMFLFFLAPITGVPFLGLLGNVYDALKAEAGYAIAYVVHAILGILMATAYILSCIFRTNSTLKAFFNALYILIVISFVIDSSVLLARISDPVYTTKVAPVLVLVFSLVNFLSSITLFIIGKVMKSKSVLKHADGESPDVSEGNDA